MDTFQQADLSDGIADWLREYPDIFANARLHCVRRALRSRDAGHGVIKENAFEWGVV